MNRPVPEETIDQVWHDVDCSVDRSRVADVVREVCADLDDARVTAYVALFVRRFACERLRSDAQAKPAATPSH